MVVQGLWNKDNVLMQVSIILVVHAAEALMRAVNALLISLDRLRSFPNVLMLATTNLTSSDDLAFVDRADVKQFIGLPILEARYEIFRSSLKELARVGIIDSDEDDRESLCSFVEFMSQPRGNDLECWLVLCSSALKLRKA